MMRAREIGLAAALCVLAPLVHVLALGPEIPEGTFFLVASLGANPLADDPSNLVYAFARSPVYTLIGPLFPRPLAFALFGWASHAAFNATVFALAYRAAAASDASARFGVAVAVSFLIFPVAWATGLAFHGVTFVPHDGYYGTSFRTLFWTFAGFAYLQWLTGRRRTALWVLAASCWVHPSAGILAFGLATLGALAVRDRTLLVNWVGAALLGALPTLANLAHGALPPGESVSYAQWYSSLVKDEADDFSFLFQLLYQSRGVAVSLVAILATAAAYAAFARDFRRDPSFWCVVSVPLLFIGGVVAEYVFAVQLATPLIHVLVALTPGYRLLGFAFFPLVSLWAGLGALAIARVPGAANARIAGLGVAGVVAGWLALLVVGFTSGNTAATVRYAAWAMSAGRVAGLDAYLEAAAAVGRPAYFEPPLYRVDPAELVTYPQERDLLRIRALDRGQPALLPDEAAAQSIRAEDFFALVDAIRRELPTGAGLITPPYLRHFRDSLVDYRIFFEEHHDGNLMMGSPVFLGFWQERMQAVLGLTYETLPSKASRLSYTAMRTAYLANDTQRVAEIARRHPDFGYWISERGHALGFDEVLEAGGLVVYALPGRAGSADRP